MKQALVLVLLLVIHEGLAAEAPSVLPDMMFYHSIGATVQEQLQIESRHYNAKRSLHQFFFNRSIFPTELELKIRHWVEYLEMLEKKYLKAVNNMVVGNKNSVRGTQNRVFADEYKVQGHNNLVLIGSNLWSNVLVTGSNYIRIGNFDICRDLIPLIHTNPYQAIKQI